MKKNIIAIIQARSGSKGIKNKNIYSINNHPLIAYTIYAAKKCKLIDDVVISTDSRKYASIAIKYGASAPFLRPKKLSGDKIFSVTSLRYALLKSEKFFKKKYDYIIELPCVAPLRDSSDIENAIEIAIKNSKADSVISVTNTGEKHPTRLKKIINNRIFDITKEFPEKGQNSRRQDLKPDSYIRNGAIYLMKRKTLVEKISRSGKYSCAYIMPENKSINIDTTEDLKLAENIIVSGNCNNFPGSLLQKDKQLILKNIIQNFDTNLITTNIEIFPDKKKEIIDKFSFIYAPDCKLDELKKILAAHGNLTNWICSPCPDYKIDKKIFKLFKNLKNIITPSTGTSHINLKDAKKYNIKVHSLKDTRHVKNIKASSEFAFALMLSTIRFIPIATKFPLLNKWRDKDTENKLRSYEFANKNLCIVGFGRIGSNLAKFSKNLGFNIFAYDPFKKIKVKYVKQISNLNNLIKIADILFLSVHLNNNTIKMLNIKNLKNLKKGSFLINVSRGEIIDEKALIYLLKNKTITAAGVDVITNEQTKNISKNLLIRYAKKNSNLIITPHIAGLTFDSERKALNFALEKLNKFSK